MVRSRTLAALVGLGSSFGVSLAAWISVETLLFALFLPFVPVCSSVADDDSATNRIDEFPSEPASATVASSTATLPLYDGTVKYYQ